MDPKNLNPEQREKLEQIGRYKQENDYKFALQVVQEISDKCTKKCITYPGKEVSRGETQCLQLCADRFMESFELMMNATTSRLQQEMQKQGAAGGMYGAGTQGYSFS